MDNDVIEHRETQVAEEAFQREDEDHYGAEPEWNDRHQRLGDAEELLGGYERYTLTADEYAADDVRKAVAKLSKKLKRHGGEVRIVSEVVTQEPHKWLRKRGVPVIITQVVFTIEAPAVAGENAKLVGTFELAEEGVEVYRHVMPGYSGADLEPFIGRWWECDHCGYNRRRHASFVCEQEDGTRLLIGRQCSMSYMGLSPAEIIARASIAKVLTNGDGDEEPLIGGSGYRLHMETVVDKAYLVAKKFGGYSREIADDFYRDMSALLGASDYGRDRTNHNIREEYKERGVPSPPLDLQALADYVDKADGEYGHNLRIALSCVYIKPKRYRTVVSGVGMFVGRALKQKKAQEAEAKRDLPPAKHLQGAEGVRVDFEGVVERCIPLPSDYGPKTLVAILCDDGARVVHFCSAATIPTAGTRYAIRATIKRHGTNKRFDTPETTITRAVYADVPEGTLL